MGTHFVGIDVSKDTFDVAVVGTGGDAVFSGHYDMTRKGFEMFEADIERLDNPCFGLESTGGYHLNLLSFLLSKTEHVYLINPLLVKRFSEATSLRKTRTDPIDATHTAQFLRQHIAQLSPFLPEDIQALSTLARLRESIVQQIAQAKTHLKQQLNITFPELEKHGLLGTNTMLAVLEHCPSAQAFNHISETQLQEILTQQAKAVGCNTRISAKQLKDLAQHSIGKVDPLLEEVIRFDIAHLQFLITKEKDITRKLTEHIEKTNKRQLEILTSIDGIGPRTAIHFLAEIKDIQRFDSPKNLIAYAGTDPKIHESGKSSKRGGISKRGSASLRRTGYIMTQAVIRHNPRFKQYYQKKRAEGMPYRKAVIATLNKLFRVICALLKKNETFSQKAIIYS